VSLEFLSPSRCEPGTLISPLRRALDDVDPALVRDLSLDGILEIRGDLDLVEPGAGEELVRLSPGRGYLLTADDPADAAERLRAEGVLAYDASGALAGLAVEGERLMRRLTDLDFDRLPAAGPLARVPALVLRGEGDAFRVYVPQELGHYVAEAVLDALAGLENA
jgi:pimeloyl-ACP methyl ester carboxylesterase